MENIKMDTNITYQNNESNEFISSTGIKVKMVGTPSIDACKNFIKLLKEMNTSYKERVGV